MDEEESKELVKAGEFSIVKHLEYKGPPVGTDFVN